MSLPTKTLNQVFLLSLAGILGGVLMFAGDMLFYYEPVSGSDFNSLDNLARRDNGLLMLGGTLGPIAAIFYSLGSLIFILVLKERDKTIGWIISISWIFMFIIGGSYHAVFPNYGFVGKLPNEFRQEQVDLVASLISMMYWTAFVFGLVSSLLLAYVFLLRKTVFPKWLALFIPTFLTLLYPVLKDFIPYPLGAVIIGGWVNLCFILFFGLTAFLFYKGKNTEMLKGA